MSRAAQRIHLHLFAGELLVVFSPKGEKLRVLCQIDCATPDFLLESIRCGIDGFLEEGSKLLTFVYCLS
jgi:hypothetical protein